MPSRDVQLAICMNTESNCSFVSALVHPFSFLSNTSVLKQDLTMLALFDSYEVVREVRGSVHVGCIGPHPFPLLIRVIRVPRWP